MNDKIESKKDAEKIPIYKWEMLSKSKKEFGIILKDEVYRIRLTRNGKLIMNK
jgi:hemin uptake protein HemP